MRQQLEVAVRHSLAARARNRLAWILLVIFVPGWYMLIGSMIPHRGAVFILRSNETLLVVDGHDLTLITAGLSAITLITGFVVFAATRRAIPFDRRLILSGYRPAALITAKTAAALAVAAAVGGYAAVVILAFWRPAALWSIAVAFILPAASYAALGLLVGVLVRGDLEGFFLIIMTALLDTFLENPVDNPLANKPILEFFPVVRTDPVRRRGRLPPPGAAGHGGAVARLDGWIHPARPGRAPAAHAAPLFARPGPYFSLTASPGMGRQRRRSPARKVSPGDSVIRSATPSRPGSAPRSSPARRRSGWPAARWPGWPAARAGPARRPDRPPLPTRRTPPRPSVRRAPPAVHRRAAKRQPVRSPASTPRAEAGTGPGPGT